MIIMKFIFTRFSPPHWHFLPLQAQIPPTAPPVYKLPESNILRFNPLKPSGHYMYWQFNIQQFYVLPTQCICVFGVDLRTNSDYFPIQHWLIGFLGSFFLKLRNSSVSFISSVFLHSQAQPSVHMLKLSSRLKGFHEICVLLGNLSKTPILIKHWQEYRTFEKKTKLFLKREMFQTKVVGKIEIHILWFTTFSPTKIVPFVGCV